MQINCILSYLHAITLIVFNASILHRPNLFLHHGLWYLGANDSGRKNTVIADVDHANKPYLKLHAITLIEFNASILHRPKLFLHHGLCDLGANDSGRKKHCNSRCRSIT